MFQLITNATQGHHNRRWEAVKFSPFAGAYGFSVEFTHSQRLLRHARGTVDQLLPGPPRDTNKRQNTPSKQFLKRGLKRAEKSIKVVVHVLTKLFKTCIFNNQLQD